MNEEKTEFNIFGKRNKTRMEHLTVGKIKIEKIVVKYLGVHLDSKLTFNEEIKNILKNGCRHKSYVFDQEFCI